MSDVSLSLPDSPIGWTSEACRRKVWTVKRASSMVLEGYHLSAIEIEARSESTHHSLISSPTRYAAKISSLISASLSVKSFMYELAPPTDIGPGGWEGSTSFE